MTLAVDIKVLGVPELEKELKRLEARVQRTIVRSALRKSAKRVRGYVVENLSNDKVNVRTGRLRQAFQETSIRGSSRRGFIRLGIAFPEREALGIGPFDKYYYPTAVEYGHGEVRAYPYMRPAVDEHRSLEVLLIGRDIGRAIEKKAGR